MEFKDIGLKDLYIDLNGEITTPLYAKEGEINSRGLRIFIVDNGKPVDTRDSRLLFYGKVEDGKIYDKEATQVLGKIGVYELTYPTSILKPGIVDVELSLQNEESILLSKTFNIEVDYRVVSGIIEDIEDEDLVSSLIEAGANEKSRIGNELAREINEVLRVNLYEQVKSDYEEGLFKGEPGQPGQPGKDGIDGVSIEELDTLLSEKADNSTIGYLADLATSDKSNIVAAINNVLAVSDTMDAAHSQKIKNVEDSLETIQLTPGPQGPDGQDGKSAYQSWLDAGNTGTEVEFLESLKGADGTGGGGSADGGSHSSNDLIENYTNSELAQVNVSADSGAGVLNMEVNIGDVASPNWIFLGIVKDEFIVETKYVYVEVYEGRQGLSADYVHPDKYTEEDYPDAIKGEIRVSQVQSPSQVNASRGSNANGNMSQVNASSASAANGQISQVNASDYSFAKGFMSQVNSSMNSNSTGDASQINASDDSVSTGWRSVVTSSWAVQNDVDSSLALGVDTSNFDREPRTSNIKIHLLAETGDILNSGVVTSGHNFTDFAELFPNKTGVKQGYGLIQTIDGHGVRPANEGEQAVGVTSATAGIILGETSFTWQNRWLKDDWGDYVYHDILDMRWEPEKGEVESDRPMITVKKQNPDYDPELEHETRQQRPDEWTVVGLTGQVYVRLKDDVQPMDYVTPWKDGIGQASQEPTNLRLMKITKDYVAEDGYKIGFCLLK